MDHSSDPSRHRLHEPGTEHRNLEHLNPVINEWNEASAHIVSRLFTIDLSGRIDGDLVDHYDVAEDNQTYTFTLRSGVTWHDGRPFTSDDVLFTFDEIVKPNARSDKRLNLGPIDSYNAPDPLTFVIHLSSPHSSLTTPLADLGILPRHVFENGSFDDDAVFDSSPIGTGPFRFVSRDSVEMVCEANETYFRGAPRISRLVVRPITNDDERVDAVLSGAIDIAQVTPNHVAMLSQNPSFEIHRFRTGVWRSMVMNVSRPILQDARVRHAISLGLDNDALIAGWSALTDPGDNLTKKYRSNGSQNGMGYSNPELDEILDQAVSEPDRDKARQIYREALEIIAEEASNIPLAYPDYVFVTRKSVTGFGDFVLDNFYEFTRFAYMFGKE